MENECLVELLQFIENTSQFYEFTLFIPRDQILKIVHRYVSILFQYPLLTGTESFFRSYCDCETYYHRSHDLNYPDIYVTITVDLCFTCGQLFVKTELRDMPYNFSNTQKLNSFVQLEYWVIRPFVLWKVRSQFEDLLQKYIPIQNLVELVGDYLYVEPSRNRNQQRKLIM